MQKLLVTKILILTTLALSSCRVPYLEPQVRMIYSETFRECRCQFYDYNELKPIGNPERCDLFYERIRKETLDFCVDNYKDNERMCDQATLMTVSQNLDYCDGIIGNDAKVWGESIKPWIFNLIETIKDLLD